MNLLSFKFSYLNSNLALSKIAERIKNQYAASEVVCAISELNLKARIGSGFKRPRLNDSRFNFVNFVSEIHIQRTVMPDDRFLDCVHVVLDGTFFMRKFIEAFLFFSIGAVSSMQAFERYKWLVFVPLVIGLLWINSIFIINFVTFRVRFKKRFLREVFYF